MKVGDLVKCHFTGKMGITIRSSGSATPTYPRWNWQPLQFLVKWRNDNDTTWAAAMYLGVVSYASR